MGHIYSDGPKLFKKILKNNGEKNAKKTQKVLRKLKSLKNIQKKL